MATSARLFENHAHQAPWKGPWEITKESTNPQVLNDTMQNHFLGPIVGMNALKKLASLLESERDKTEWAIMDEEKLWDIYAMSGLDARNFGRVTSLLEKVAIILPITEQK